MSALNRLHKPLVGFILLALGAQACSPAPTGPSPGQATEPFQPSADTRLEAGEHFFTALTIPEDVTVTLAGDVVIYVEGPISLNGTLTGDCTGVEIRGTEGLLLDGLISNTCTETTEIGPEIRIIAAGDITLGTTVSDEEVMASDGHIFISDPGGEDLDLTPMLIDDPSTALRPRTARRLTSPLRQGGGASAGNRPVRAGRGANVTVIRASGNVAINASLTAQDGKDGSEVTQVGTCDNSNNIGGIGGSIRLGARNGTLAIAGGVTLRAGNGGLGGSCTADGGCPATALAGPGGRGGSVMLGGQRIEFGAGVTLVRGNGGPGGDAWAFGDDGSDNCENGCDASSTGGKGGNAGGIGYLILEPGTVVGTPTVDGANGGAGGFAFAEGGDGKDCSTCPGGAGGKGGNGTATGGQGGNGATGDISGWAPAPNSHLKGDGGAATALGGSGGDGATCCNPPQEGGNGGAGGDATATGGQVGVRGIGGGGQRGSSDGSFTGDGGDGGDGEPPGTGGEAGDGSGDPDPVTFGEQGEDGERCFKVWVVFVGYLEGGWQHFAGYSEVIVVILVLGNDPLPVPDATVTMRINRPDGSSETLTAVTGPDGTAAVEFTIYTYGSYSVSVDNIEGENMEYDPSLNAMDSIVVNVGAGAGSVPDPAIMSVRAFYDALEAAMQARDVEFMFANLHPAVLELYGAEACRSYLAEVINNPLTVDVLAVSGPGPWEWEIDERSTSIANAYTVSANVTAQGQTTAMETHLARDAQGHLLWFTDCGDPLP